MPIHVSIIVVTKDRQVELERAIRSCMRQEGENEIIVVDDGSSDGTAAMVQSQFPSVHFIRDDVSRGYIVQRNRAARIASGEFLFSIDDDAEFSSPSIVRETLKDFAASCQIAAVAIPYIEPIKQDQEFQRAPTSDCCWITAQFVGTAYAVRRRLFLAMGGFDEMLVHQGEERGFCLRLLEAGHYVRLGTASPVRHHRSQSRDYRRMAFYGRRNDIRFIWEHVPFHQVALRLVGTTIRGFLHGLRAHAVLDTLLGIADGYRGIWSLKRQPVSRSAYNTHCRMRSNGPEIMSFTND